MSIWLVGWFIEEHGVLCHAEYQIHTCVAVLVWRCSVLGGVGNLLVKFRVRPVYHRNRTLTHKEFQYKYSSMYVMSHMLLRNLV